MSQEYYKEVRYDFYCQTCEYYKIKEEERPCMDCLDEPINYGTDRPTKYKEKE